VRCCCLVLAAVGCAVPPHPRPLGPGAITGVARDHDSGDPVAHAEIRVRGDGELTAIAATTSRADGRFSVGHLAPGRYVLTASFAGQPIEVDRIDVGSDRTSVVDVVFTLGRPDPVHVDFGDPQDGAIDHYRSPRMSASVGVIEGTVSDASTRARVAGAMVYAVPGGDPRGSLQAITDDEGRYRFDAVAPGSYTVSAYYSIGGRGQIEVRRSDIEVSGAEGVIVPLWVELTMQ
jgi:hypothetical protein